MIDLTTEEEEIIAIALTMRQNHIETGSILVGAKNIENMGEYAKKHSAKLQSLSIDQMKLIIKIEEIRAKIWH